jgi:hypothetical protein
MAIYIIIARKRIYSFLFWKKKSEIGGEYYSGTKRTPGNVS